MYCIIILINITTTTTTTGKADWQAERASRLESALDDASSEITRLNSDVMRWETRAGEKQQEVTELDLVRQMLTSQLHILRQELGPKEQVGVVVVVVVIVMIIVTLIQYTTTTTTLPLLLLPPQLLARADEKLKDLEKEYDVNASGKCSCSVCVCMCVYVLY